jgi:photosystem II stability/assembly factor-like uncharacterized protein
MAFTPFAPESNDKLGRLRPAFIFICSLLLSIACVIVCHTPTRAATRKQAKRPVARKPAVGYNVRRSRTRRRTKISSAASLKEPRRAEVEEDILGRQSWFLSKRAYPFKEIPAAARRRAWEARPKNIRASVRALGAQPEQVWMPIGPAPTVPPPPPSANVGLTSGRINAVAVSPTNPQLVLVGASTGGIWRSSDGGAHFAPVSDEQVDLAVSWITFAPSDPAIVYAGMGDIDYEYLGAGVLKSTNGGQTWARVSNSTLPEGVTARLEVDPTNPQRVYLAQYISKDRATNRSDASGFFISTDGGVNWTKTLAGQLRDIAIHPTNPQTLYAGLALKTHIAGTSSSLAGFYRSTDGGNTWTDIPVPTDGLHASLWDIRVAVTPADPQRIYIYYGTLFFGETRFQVSFDGGSTWQARSLSKVDSGQFGFSTYLHADPANADIVYLGSRDLYKSADGGATWANLTNNFSQTGSTWSYHPYLASTHADQQAFAFEPGNSSVVYLANDGGIWKSTNGGASVQSLNATLSLVQFNSLAVHPTDEGFTIGGTQDNGTQRRLKDSSTNAPTSQWVDMSGSDGGACVINPVNPNIFYGTYYSAWVNRYKVTASGISFDKEIGTFSTWGDSNINTRIAFYPPFTGNGVDQTIYFGTWRLFKSTNLGDSWIAPAPETDLTKGGRDVLSAIAIARSDTNVIYTGSAQGQAMLSTDGGSNWRDITAGLPNRFIESIKVDPANPAVAYLSVSGYGSGHVFKTTNAGQTWTDVSGNLPNVPTSALLLDPLNSQTLYAGTDIGVFRSTVGGTIWETFNNGLPPVMITAFTAQPSGRIQVATYGRGAYELTTRATSSPSVGFGAASYQVGEGDRVAVVNVRRTGDASAPLTVDFATVDDPAAVRCDDSNNNHGAAYARCDYATTVETLSWGAGDTQPKTVQIPLINDAHLEGAETVQLRLSNAQGAPLGNVSVATLVIQDNDTSSAALNPTFSTPFFVRMQYLDFLSREPEAGEPWSGILNNCADAYNLNPNSSSVLCDRIRVSQSFFGSPEFRLKGFFVYNFYRVAFNRRPEYTEIIPDMRSVTGVTPADTFARRAAFPVSITQRPEFKAAYDTLSNASFVDALLDRHALQQITTPDPRNPEGAARVTLTRAELINRLGATGAEGLTRAQVLRAIVDSEEVAAAEYNGAFVAMQYYGYLRRTPEDSGYQAWLKVINQDPNNIRIMVNGFMNSREYRLRFGQP